MNFKINNGEKFWTKFIEEQTFMQQIKMSEALQEKKKFETVSSIMKIHKVIVQLLLKALSSTSSLRHEILREKFFSKSQEIKWNDLKFKSNTTPHTSNFRCRIERDRLLFWHNCISEHWFASSIHTWSALLKSSWNYLCERKPRIFFPAVWSKY